MSTVLLLTSMASLIISLRSPSFLTCSAFFLAGFAALCVAALHDTKDPNDNER